MKFIGKSLLLTGFGVTCGAIGALGTFTAITVGFVLACEKQPKLQGMFTSAVGDVLYDVLGGKKKQPAKRYTYSEWKRVKETMDPADKRLRVVEDYANGKTEGDK
jgi:hypothetical protein